MPQMLVAFDFLEGGAMQIVIAGSGEDARARGLLKEIRSHFLPRAVVILLGDEASRRFFGEKNEAVRTMKIIDGKPAAYVCQNFTCQSPLTDRVELANCSQVSYSPLSRRSSGRFLRRNRIQLFHVLSMLSRGVRYR